MNGKPEEPPSHIVTVPSDAEIKKAFEDYTLAVGKVAYAWNYLHERLAALFAQVIQTKDRSVALAVWYSSPSDRTEREMLRAAIIKSPMTHWGALTQARDDLLWLLNECEKLSFHRDNAVHAPASMFVTPGNDSEMAAAFFSGHKRAANLKGKNLLQEFEWVEAYAKALSIFAQQTTTGLAFRERYSWPDRPKLPSPGQKSMSLGH